MWAERNLIHIHEYYLKENCPKFFEAKNPWLTTTRWWLQWLPGRHFSPSYHAKCQEEEIVLGSRWQVVKCMELLIKDQSVEICQISKCGNLSNVRLWNVETEQNSQNHYDRNHSRTPKYWMSFHCNVQIPVGTPRQVHLTSSKWDQKVEQVHDNLRGCWWANSCKKSQCSSVNLHRHHRKRGQRWRGRLSSSIAMHCNSINALLFRSAVILLYPYSDWQVTRSLYHQCWS